MRARQSTDSARGRGRFGASMLVRLGGQRRLDLLTSRLFGCAPIICCGDLRRS